MTHYITALCLGPSDADGKEGGSSKGAACRPRHRDRRSHEDAADRCGGDQGSCGHQAFHNRDGGHHEGYGGFIEEGQGDRAGGARRRVGARQSRKGASRG